MKTNCNSDQSGFTLIELAIVLVIIGMLVGMGAGLLGPMTERLKLSQTREAVDDAYAALLGYAAANRTLPAALANLSSRTKDAYSADLLYYPVSGITGSDLCTNSGTYFTVTDEGTSKTNVAFIIYSIGRNACNETGTASPFTKSIVGTVGTCASDANAGYDDTVKYIDIDQLREQICNAFKIVTDTLPIGKEEVSYASTTLEATDGTPAYTWALSSGALPTGLSMSTAGVIFGTPSVDGSFNFTVTVTDAESRTSSKSFAITINPNDPEINTAVMHYSSVGLSYTANLAASGGTGSYTWLIFSGALPTGLSLNPATGVISGTPTIAGTYAFTVQITDSSSRVARRTLSIAIN